LESDLGDAYQLLLKHLFAQSIQRLPTVRKDGRYLLNWHDGDIFTSSNRNSLEVRRLRERLIGLDRCAHVRGLLRECGSLSAVNTMTRVCG
jgi:hypothetical protein